MDILNLIFLLTLAVAASRPLANLIPLPLPILQILMGSVLALPPLGMTVELDPEIFMMLFIPPLLFYDGWKIPKKEFTEYGGQIAAMSLLLVLLTVAVVGYVIHWLLPTIPMAASFALAAILSPTDALAVIAIAQGRLPRHMAHQLEGEAMMNDATGLVSFKFAIAAAVTGSFSLLTVSGEFLVVALGGLLIGGGLSWLVGKFKQWMTARHLYDSATYVVTILLLPFAAFFLAEHAGMSGILSAVAAGMVQSRVDMLPVKTSTRILNRSIWEMLDFCFNGAVFLLLGLQFPGIVERVWSSAGPQELGIVTLSGYALALMGVLLVIRFAFVYVYHWAEERILRLRGKSAESQPRLLVTALSSVAGVRGAITLAGVLSVPLLINGAPFPGRDLMIFIAAAVIILSLLIGALGVPYFMRFLSLDDLAQHERELVRARQAATQSALDWLENRAAATDEEEAELHRSIAAHLIESYRQELQAMTLERDERAEQARRHHTLETELRRQAIAVQRQELYRLRKRRRIDEPMLQTLIRELDYEEASLS
ncbi:MULTISPECIES: Na+/H+ antiporter [Modicisalibacter]|uniref:Na+/H+ antiporter n=1 Tax=Modicisalibacter TaxID=574347 RepID=UPI00100A3AF9|nr:MULTISPECIES: Na+/H+ antiporter [Halomonadaceae]MBZ9558795.1 Na+/H+ antiporter [Modicisalibacter sp. R2A 31.J]MBZ9575314.1 Na+/H+ antiporter [Modicisalibacter sp. MOD 31.J]